MPTRWKVVTWNNYSYPGRCIMQHYPEGEIVVSKGKLGIFVFEKESQAEDSINRACSTRSSLKIIKVNAIGRGKRRTCCPSVTKAHEKRIDIFLKKKSNLGIKEYAPIKEAGRLRIFDTMNVWLCPPGTMTYESVEVLESTEM